jgi:predicted transcriptional regulator
MTGLDMTQSSGDAEFRKLVAELAAAYFTNNQVRPEEISTVIDQITRSLAAVRSDAAPAAAAPSGGVKPTAAQIRRSVTPEALISFEDDKPYKTLRRHLASRGMTPDDYRKKWGLPADYPMTAPAYSQARSNMAKASGLGSRAAARPGERAVPQASKPPAAQPAPAQRRTRRAITPISAREPS